MLLASSLPGERGQSEESRAFRRGENCQLGVQSDCQKRVEIKIGQTGWISGERRPLRPSEIYRSPVMRVRLRKTGVSQNIELLGRFSRDLVLQAADYWAMLRL